MAATATTIASQTAISQYKVEEEELEGVPVCGANYSSPVVEQANFIEEVSYRIGSRKYIENAPHF